MYLPRVMLKLGGKRGDEIDLDIDITDDFFDIDK